MAFHLSDGQTVTSVKLRGSFEEALADLLTDPRFCQPHKSFVVNMDHVRFQGGGHMEVLTGQAVPVSPARRTAVLDQFLGYSVARRS